MGTRRERVILDLEDHLSGGMVKAAASTGLLKRELNSLSHDAVRTRSSVSDIDKPIQNVGQSSSTSSREVDRLSGRMRILADVAAILGPALIPIGAVGVPAISGLAAQMGFAAAGAGTMILAFQGIGDTLKAVNKAALEPTTQNLEAAQIALERLSPEAQQFVAHLSRWTPEFRKLRDIAGEGLFPGLTFGLDRLMSAAPHVEGVIASISNELGSIAADTGQALASERWTTFLDFIAAEAPEALGDMASALGNTAHAVAALWMATDPLNDDFSHWLVDATERLDTFASGLSQSEGFAEFIDYVEENGPQVAETLGAVANAALQIVEAASPLGGPALKGIEAVANVVADIADSDLGTPIFAGIAALALLNRTMAITSSLQEKTFGGPALAAFRQSRTGIQGMIADCRVLRTEQARTREISQNMVPVPLFRKGSEEAKRLTGNIKNLGKGAAGVAGLAVATTGVADGLGLSNAASLALMGTLAGPWGAALGGGIGLTLDLAHANDDLEAAIASVNNAARSGDLQVMEDGIRRIKGEIDDLNHTTGVGDFFSDTLKKAGSALKNPGSFMPSHADEAKARNAVSDGESATAARKAAIAQEALAHGFEATAAGAEAASQSTQDFRNSIQRLNDTLEGRASMRDYEAALDDFRDSLKKNGKTFDINTAKGRENQAQLDNIAATALKMAEKLKGVDRIEFLAAARRQFVSAARDAGMTRQAAQDLADKVLGLNGIVGKPKIVIDANGAVHVISDIQQRLNQFKDKTVRVWVQQVYVQGNKNRADFADFHQANGQAEGGTVPGARYPYGDKVLSYLAPGEEVITNRHGEADRFRADRAAGRIPAYADGGAVGRGNGVAMAGPVIDYGRLAAAIVGDRVTAFRDSKAAHAAALREVLRELPIERAPRDPLLMYGAV